MEKRPELVLVEMYLWYPFGLVCSMSLSVAYLLHSLVEELVHHRAIKPLLGLLVEMILFLYGGYLKVVELVSKSCVNRFFGYLHVWRNYTSLGRRRKIRIAISS